MTSPTRWRTRQRPRSHTWFTQAAATKQNGAVACPTPKALPVTVQAFQKGLLTGSLFNIHSIPTSQALRSLFSKRRQDKVSNEQKRGQEDPLGTAPSSPWRSWGVGRCQPHWEPPRGPPQCTRGQRSSGGSPRLLRTPAGATGTQRGCWVPAPTRSPINPTHSQLRPEALQRPDGAGVHDGA